jgi:hypothetical protein
MPATFACVVLFAPAVVAQEVGQPAKVGGVVAIEITGDLAKEYARRSAMGAARTDGIQIQMTGTIAQKLADGRLRIEHTSPVNRDGQPSRLLTLSATVDPTAITTRVIPQGTPIAANPGARAIVSVEETRSFVVKLPDLKNVKLRTWTLSEEIGE